MNKIAVIAIAVAAISSFVVPRAYCSQPARPFPAKGFEVGCNYWASHAGMYMWRNWDGAQVERDLDRLASCGITVMRVFPLWPDFQPLTAQFIGGNAFRSFAQNDAPLKNYAAVDDEMMSRFRFLCDAAEKRGMGLVVGLITGFMSSRMFVPPALERKNVLVDAEAVMWECRFVRYFVNSMKDHRAIVAWDLGNECNCMSGADSAQMWNWMHSISSEIRLADPSRPVVSGMHSVSARWNAKCNVRLQGELMDVLTTHPYPLWTDDCNTEEFDTIRNGCHAACETTMYANLSGKEAFVEEAGSMGPGIVSETRAAASMRSALFSCWAANLHAYLWWCAFDQDRLDFPPYEWTAIERELGLFTADGVAKPTALQLKEFSSFLKTLPFDQLPPRKIDAVVVVSEDEDAWRSSFGAWTLAREAGFEVKFALAESPLPESNFYILPSGVGYNTYSGDAYRRVMAKAASGATVLVTLGNGASLSEMRRYFGIEVENHYRRQHSFKVDCGRDSFVISEPYIRVITPKEAKVLLKDETGRPVMTENAVGKGKVLFFNGALERNAKISSWPVYEMAAKCAGVKRLVTCRNPLIGISEHADGNAKTYVVAVNYAPTPVIAEISVAGKIGRVFRGQCDEGRLSIPANDAAVFEVNR